MFKSVFNTWTAKILIAIALFAGILIGGYSLKPKQLPKVDHQLVLNINECEGIADKAVVNLQEFLEFQRLEKLARKSRVMQLCMSDRGYKINQAWLAAHRAEADALAIKESITQDAAIEALKFKHMYFNQAQQSPVFWVPIK